MVASPFAGPNVLINKGNLAGDAYHEPNGQVGDSLIIGSWAIGHNHSKPTRGFQINVVNAHAVSAYYS